MIDERAATVTRPSHLMRGGSAMIHLGLIAGRAASALRKIQDRMPLDEMDTDSLQHLSALIRDAADRVQFFDSNGKMGVPPADSLAPQIDTAIEVARNQRSRADSSKLATSLRDLAKLIEEATTIQEAESLSSLHLFCTNLSSSVLRHTSSVGETIRHLT